MQSIILTPNLRLAAVLREQHQQTQIKTGALSWQTKPIMPLVSWLENIWLEHTKQQIETTPLLLTSYQEQILWEDIIRRSPESEHLLQINHTAKAAAMALELLKQYNIPLNHSDLNFSDNTQPFLIWAKQFQKTCRQNNWLDRASIPDYLQDTKILFPSAITLIGFIDIQPQIKKLLDYISKQGTIVTIQPMKHQNKNKSYVSVKDKEEEILTMARWAKATYEAKDLQEMKIGCIIPDLNISREHIKRTFQNVFKEDFECMCNISAGKPLASYPIIYTALKLLELTENTRSIDLLNHVLRTPFIGDAETESQQRALCDRYLQNNNIINIELDHLSYCPLLKDRLSKIALLQRPQKQSPSEWSNYFNELLLELGWPGERSLNSEEYQTIKSGWQKLLNDFATLDLIFESISLKNAKHYLSIMAESTIFQPQSPIAPIQILGTLEAAGLCFDHLWMMGMDDRSWPPTPSPNPFIPYSLQKKLKMPNASAERELEYCQKLTDQFISHSTHIIFSHSSQHAEIILRPSALIKDFSKILPDTLNISPYKNIERNIYASSQIEQLDDFTGPTLENNKPLYGGASIFKLQALCPFRAFGELRLQARFVDTPSIGLLAKDRGKLLHKVLEFCWLALKDSTQLHLLNPEDLKKLVKKSIDTAFAQSKETQPKNNVRYLKIEKKRLAKILLAWFEIEKDRPPFNVIACETEREVSIGPISFKLRIDRIDQLANNGKIIIDYKTGKNNSIKSWFGDRPDEPQLPLYCITDEGSVSAIAFAELHPSLMGLKGICKHKSDISGIKSISENKHNDITVWDEQIKQWKIILTNLGNNFYHGIATVDPKDSEETCRQCHLQSLCRIYENTNGH